MAIDTQSLTQIITDFCALQSKDAVSPESLGYILQRIADLLATGAVASASIHRQKQRLIMRHLSRYWRFLKSSL